MSRIRMTYATAAVLQALDGGLRYGFDIAGAAGIRGGTVYPILRRLADAGLVESEWEDVAIARAEGRPPRRYYRLRRAAQELVALARSRYPLDELGPSGSVNPQHT